MAIKNFADYLPEPLKMKFGKWTITSPVPNGRIGKQLRALADLATGIAGELLEEKGQVTGDDVNQRVDGMEIEGISTSDDIGALVLGQTQIDRLIEDGCPLQYIDIAATYAYVRWAYNSVEAADAWLENNHAGSRPKAPVKRKSQAGTAPRKH